MSAEVTKRLDEIEKRGRENWPTSEDVAILATVVRAALAEHVADWREWCRACNTPAPCPTVRRMAAALAQDGAR